MPAAYKHTLMGFLVPDWNVLINDLHQWSLARWVFYNPAGMLAANQQILVKLNNSIHWHSVQHDHNCQWTF